MYLLGITRGAADLLWGVFSVTFLLTSRGLSCGFCILWCCLFKISSRKVWAFSVRFLLLVRCVYFGVWDLVLGGWAYL